MSNRCKGSLKYLLLLLSLVIACSDDKAVGPTSTLDDTITWVRTYGGPGDERSSGVVETTDGCYFVAGTQGPWGESDMWILKVDRFGDTLWTQTHGGDGHEMNLRVAAANDGGAFVLGQRNSTMAGADLCLMRLSNNGELLWSSSKYCEGEYNSRGVAPSSDGGCLVLGSDYNQEPSTFLTKYSRSGGPIWTKLTPDIFCTELVSTGDGGYLVGGAVRVESGEPYHEEHYDIYVEKVSASGETVWTWTYGREGVWEMANSVIATQDGGAAVTTSYGYYDGRDDDINVFRLDASGQLAWTNSYDLGGNEGSGPIAQSTDGGLVVAGKTDADSSNSQIYLLSVDTFGGRRWDRRFGGGSGYHGVSSVVATADGGYLIAGSIEGDVWLIKTDANGDVQ